MFNADKIKQHVTVDAEGADLQIDVSDKGYTVAGVKVETVGMRVSTQADEEGYYYDGDMYVTWNMDGLENTGGGDMGMLLLRGDNDEVGAVMGAFYWDGAFTSTLHEILQAAGFSAEAATDVSTSEWGMQDEGRASYDANTIADEVRKAIA